MRRWPVDPETIVDGMMTLPRGGGGGERVDQRACCCGATNVVAALALHDHVGARPQVVWRAWAQLRRLNVAGVRPAQYAKSEHLDSLAAAVWGVSSGYIGRDWPA